jgi:hypothetical protein
MNRPPPLFIELQLPRRFILEVQTADGGWIDHGIYDAEVFIRIEDGSYVCAGYGGSPTYLRCISRDRDVITVLDGAGDPFRYRIVAVNPACV